MEKGEDTGTEISETKRDSVCLQILRFNCQSDLSLQTSIRKIAIFMLSHWNLKVYNTNCNQSHNLAKNINKWITTFSYISVKKKLHQQTYSELNSVRITIQSKLFKSRTTTFSHIKAQPSCCFVICLTNRIIYSSPQLNVLPKAMSKNKKIVSS